MTSTNSPARNVLVSIVNQIATWILSFCVTIIMPQHLGSKGLGEIGLAFSIAGLCSTVITLGTSTVVVREVARDHGRVSDLLPTTLALRIPLAIFALVVALVVTLVLHYTRQMIVLVMLAELAMVLGAMYDGIVSVLQGLEQIPKQNITIFTERTIYSVGTIVLLLMHQPIWTLMAISLLSSSIAFVIAVVLIRPFVHRLVCPTVASMIQLMKDGLPFAASSVFTSLYSQADSPIIEKLGTMSMVGWYNLGRRLVGAVLFFPVALTSALLPTLSRMSYDDPDSFAPMVRRMINLVLIVVAPFATLLIFGARQILVILHYPADFIGSIPILGVFGAGFVAWYLSQVVGTSLIASDKQAALSRIAGIAAIVSVPLCIAMVLIWQARWHNGAVGAALSDVALELFLLVCYLRASSHKLMGLDSFWTVVRCCAAALPLIIALYLTRFSVNTGTIVMYGILGAFAYPVLCVLFRCIDSQDIGLVRAALKRRTSAA